MAPPSNNGFPLLAEELRIDLSGTSALRQRERCERLLSTLPAEPSLQRVVLTAHLVAALADGDPHAAARHACDVRAWADALNHPIAEAYALTVHGLTDHSPDAVGRRVIEARRILSIAEEHTPALASAGHFLLLTGLLEQGQLRTVDLELSPYGESITRFPNLTRARHTNWFRCLRAILDGRTTEAEQLANELLATADETNETTSRNVWAAQIGTIRWMQGRIFEMEPAFLAARQAFPHQQLWEISLAWLWHLQGRDTAARTLFEDFSSLDEIPRDRNFLVTATILAELAAKIGTLEQAELLRDALLPYANRVVPVGLGLAFWGTIARTLGLLSIRLGRLDEARTLFDTAIEVCARSGAQAWLAESQLELAELELTSDGDLVAAAELATQAERACAALEFPALLERAQEILKRLPTAQAPAPVGYAPADPGQRRPEVRVLGAFEVTDHTGTSAQWTSRKARELLKLLVSRRGIATSREVLMHYLWPDVAPADLANRFSVALSTIRRALDPRREWPSQQFIVTSGSSLFIDLTTVRVDVMEFLSSAQGEDEMSLRRAVRLYTGEAFAEDPYADWAEALRAEAQTAFCAAARRLAVIETAAGDHLAASELYRRVLDVEPYDETAHEGLVTALTALGAQAQIAMVQLRRQALTDDLIS